MLFQYKVKKNRDFLHSSRAISPLLTRLSALQNQLKNEWLNIRRKHVVASLIRVCFPWLKTLFQARRVAHEGHSPYELPRSFRNFLIGFTNLFYLLWMEWFCASSRRETERIAEWKDHNFLSNKTGKTARPKWFCEDFLLCTSCIFTFSYLTRILYALNAKKGIDYCDSFWVNNPGEVAPVWVSPQLISIKIGPPKGFAGI